MRKTSSTSVKVFSHFILRHSGWVAALGTVLGFIGCYYSVLLYKNLRTDIQELLPTTARSVLDLREVSNRLESIENLGVLVFSSHVKESKKFVIDLARELDKVPRDVIASVDFRIDRELNFFKARQALYMELGDLKRLKNYIHDRIEYEKELYNPLHIFDEIEIPEPKIDFLALKNKYKGKTAPYERLPGGFYATEDETKRVLLVNLPGTSNGIHGQLRLKNAVVEAIQKLNPTSYAPDIQVKYTSGVEDSIEEQAALVADLELSTVLVCLLVTVGMLFFYRAVRATLALVLSLFMGTLWTFGLSYFAVGYLNANSAFLGSIVIGNGINFGIIYLARYLEERRNLHNNLRANRIAMQQTATSTGAAALAAGLSYGSLILTGFRGFKQFGVIGLIGMILCWISAFTLLPAYLTVFDRMRSLVSKKPKHPKPYLAGAVAFLVGKFPLAIGGIFLAITGISVGYMVRYNPNILETDLSKLRDRGSLTEGSAYLSRYLDEIFQRYLSPLVILPRSAENADKIAAALKKIQAQEGEGSLISSVQTLNDFIPKNQNEKIQVLKEIKGLVPPSILRRISPEERKRVSEFLTPEVLRPFTKNDLPPLLLRKFTEKDGSIGKLVLVEPPLNNATWDGNNLIRFIDQLRNTADSIEPGIPVAGGASISSDMIRAISTDGPRATLFALVAVVLLVVLLFRNLKTIGLVLFSLFLGVAWLGGIIFAFELKINFLNFIALPITFGIGVDYGVNVFQRYREERKKDILNTIRATGSAVGLSSFSTMVGYGSLLIASNQGFVSFGRLAVAGELTCVVAAVVALPAFIILIQRWGKKPL